MDVVRQELASVRTKPSQIMAMASFAHLLSQCIQRFAPARVVLFGLTLVSAPQLMAQTQIPYPPSGRAAMLLPPRAPDPSEPQVVARGAIDDTSIPPFATTPVTRPANRTPTTGQLPAWLSGSDVVPASAVADPNLKGVAPVNSQSQQPAGDPSIMTKGVNRIRGLVASDKPVQTVPPAADSRKPTDPNSPLQGTDRNGAPVLAGPPAWRWYGYGTVTPGSNTYAPTGQYPRASANWYSVTRATPGAFPIPIVNPYRQAPGIDPPEYPVAGIVRQPVANDLRNEQAALPVFTMPTIPPQGTRVAPQTYPVAPPVSAPSNAAPRFTPPPPPSTSKFNIGPTGIDQPMLIPSPVARVEGPTASTIGEIKLPVPVPRSTPPVGVPALVPPPTHTPLASSAAKTPDGSMTVIQSTKSPETIKLDPIMSHQALPSPVAQGPKGTPTPSLLPVFAPSQQLPSNDEVRWQNSSDKGIAPPPGTWVPATPKTGSSESEANLGQPAFIARGQAPAETTPAIDPITKLIQTLCQGRAGDVDIRWSGSKSLMVCFEVRSAAEAHQLVRDLSARPELGPYQIDFCVLVKR